MAAPSRVSTSRRGASSVAQAGQGGKALRASNHLFEILRHNLDVSRIEANRFALQEADVQLDGAFQNLEDFVRTQMAGKALKLDLTLSPALHGCMLHGDERRLSRVLLNLTGNAVKYEKLTKVRSWRPPT